MDKILLSFIRSKMNKSTKIQPTNKNKKPTFKVASAPAARGVVSRLPQPKFSMPKPPHNDGRIIVRHREYISDIPGSIGFTAIPFQINPGLALSFPWLNTIAIAYETYRFKRLSFHYCSSKSTATNGTVMLSVDYDASDEAPTLKTSAGNYSLAARGPVWDTFTYECSPADLAKLNQRYIRYGSLLSGQNQLMYDVGTLYVCPSAEVDTSIIGELHAEYEVELFTPQFDLSAYALATAAKYTAQGTINTSNWLGATILQSGGVGAIYNAPRLYIQNPGQYLFTYTIYGTGLTQGSTPSFSTGTNPFLLMSSTVSPTQITIVFTGRIDNPVLELILINYLSSFTTIAGAVLRVSYYATSLQ